MKFIFPLFIHIIIVSAVIFLFWRLRFKKKEYPKPIEVSPGVTVLTSPYLDIHNDYIQLYFREIDGGYLLTDDGATINTLEASGLLNDRKGKDLLGNLLKDRLVLRSENELWKAATSSDFNRTYKAFIYKLREINLAFEAYAKERK